MKLHLSDFVETIQYSAHLEIYNIKLLVEKKDIESGS